jgi:hypothetical protein
MGRRTSMSPARDWSDVRQARLTLLAELREVDHWRRLVTARIDLAVAAVAAVDEPVVRNLPAAPAVPFGLRELLGLAPAASAGAEVELLLRLRAAQRDLDAYAAALRAAIAGSGEPSKTGSVASVVVLADRRRPGPRPDGVA